MPIPQPNNAYMKGPNMGGYHDMGVYDNSNIYYGNMNHTK
jgi:hypothetical protein